jgi:hypothetical protein
MIRLALPAQMSSLSVRQLIQAHHIVQVQNLARRQFAGEITYRTMHPDHI